MSERHFRNGSDFPPLKPGLMRIYSMKFCPWAQRTRMALIHKKIPHETVNINLKDKPDWFVKRFPLAMVPVLEKDGHTVYESAICNEYLDDTYPEEPLMPKDAYGKAQQKMLMERFRKVTTIYYAILAFASDVEKRDEHLEEHINNMHAALAPFEEALSARFFGGDTVGMVDLHIWPHIEHFVMMNLDIKRTIVQWDKFPKLSDWINAMKQTESVRATLNDEDSYEKFLDSRKNGIPNYDIGMA